MTDSRYKGDWQDEGSYPMTPHSHSFSVDTACECGAVLSRYVQELRAEVETLRMTELPVGWMALSRASVDLLMSDKAKAEADAARMREALRDVLSCLGVKESLARFGRSAYERARGALTVAPAETPAGDRP